MSLGEELPPPAYANVVGAQRDSTEIILTFLYRDAGRHVCVGRIVLSLENSTKLIGVIQKAQTSTEDTTGSRP